MRLDDIRADFLAWKNAKRTGETLISRLGHRDVGYLLSLIDAMQPVVDAAVATHLHGKELTKATFEAGRPAACVSYDLAFAEAVEAYLKNRDH